MKYLLDLFNVKRSFTRYEIRWFISNYHYYEEHFKEAQDEGWEIAGDIVIRNDNGNVTDTWYYIPMKRRV